MSHAAADERSRASKQDMYCADAINSINQRSATAKLRSKVVVCGGTSSMARMGNEGETARAVDLMSTSPIKLTARGLVAKWICRASAYLLT